MQFKKSYLVEVAIVILLALIWIGCEGPSGPAGRDANVQDTQPPILNWRYPAGGDTIRDQDTLELNAYDNSVVDSVEFFVNGRDSVPGFKVLPPAPPYYRVAWNTTLTTLTRGMYTLQARAFDRAMNVGWSPTLFVYVVDSMPGLIGIHTLQHFSGESVPNIAEGWPLPDQSDTTLEYAVKLTPTQNCSLLFVRFAVSTNNSAHPINLLVCLYADNGTGPGELMDSVEILAGNYRLSKGLDTAYFDNPHYLLRNHPYYISLKQNEGPDFSQSILVNYDNTQLLGYDLYHYPENWFYFDRTILTNRNLMIGAVVRY